METELQVPARYYARIAEVLGDSLDLPELLRSMGISATLLSDPESRLRLSQVEELISEIVRLSRRTDLGYELGKLLSANSHSFVGFGMLNSVNLDQALRFEAQYFRLIMPSFRMRYISGPEYAEMQFVPRVAMSHLALCFHLEAIGMAALREISDLTGSRRPACRLDLSIEEPAHARRYATELRDVHVRFAADITPSVRLRIFCEPRSMYLDMADSNALRVAESRCAALVQRIADGRQFADWVAMTLREVAESLPSLGELAAQLNLSRRTLNRYLQREGTTYRQLAGRIQHDLACERLCSGMNANEVAYSLGFSDPSNFSRAFRSRAGYSPGRHQDKIGESAVR